MTKEQQEFIDKWLIILLSLDNNKPVRGKIRLVKEFFVIWQKFFLNKGNIAEFFSYHFGPYSTLLAVRNNELYTDGIIDYKPSGNDILYTLTDRGFKRGQKYLEEENEEIIMEIQTLKNRYAKISTGKILGEIYQNYPEYKDRSLVANQYYVKATYVKPKPEEIINEGEGLCVSTSPQDKFAVSNECKAKVLEYLQ